MRLSTAFSSLGTAALLVAAPSAAQTATTTTTTDVYDVPILSAAGNVTGLPGGNEVCGAQRVRKPWGALSPADQALYVEASGLALANGAVAEFAAIAADSLGQAQGQYSCAFFSWQRRLLLAYESYLRDLDDRFACLTVPYYDVHTAYLQAVNGQCTNMFDCSGIFQAMGSPRNSTAQTSVTLNGINATGYATVGAPYGACSNNANANDNDNANANGNGNANDNDAANCTSYVVRNDVASKAVPSGASFASFQSVVATSGDYATFLQGIQYGVHHEVLDAIGGVLATAAAAHDVLYYSWHAALDMYLHVYHLCRIGVPLTPAQIVASLEVFANATQSCGGVDGVDAQSPLLMRTTVDGQVVDVSQHPTLGPYFGYVGSESWNYADIQQLGDYSYTYELPEMLRQQILSNNDVCTGFNRAFAASYSSLDAAAVKRTMSRRTTTRTTTTKTTRIVDGKRVTTTKVTKTVTRANSTTASASGAGSTVMRGQLVSPFGYSYLGNFSTNDEAFGEGTFVTNGYTGYTAFYSAEAITTKHNGIVSANFSSTSSSASSTARTAVNTSARADATYSNTSNVVANVTVGTSLVARNITASVATSGSYWAWQRTAYDGLYSRFDGNMDLVTTHMKLLECFTFNSVYGLSNFSSTFVTNKNLVTNRVQCGQRLDLVRSGLLQLAVRSSSYTAESLRFASATVISTIRSTYRRVTTREVTHVRRSYTQRVQASLDSAQESRDNITMISTGRLGNNETSSTVVDTGYVMSNSTSTTAESAGNASASTTTTTTTTTPADASDTLAEAWSESTEPDVLESTFAPENIDITAQKGSSPLNEGTDMNDTMTTTTTGANGESNSATTPESDNTMADTITTVSGGSNQTTTTTPGTAATIVTTDSGDLNAETDQVTNPTTGEWTNATTGGGSTLATSTPSTTNDGWTDATTGGGATMTTSGQADMTGEQTNTTTVDGSSKTASGNTVVMTGWTSTASGSDVEMPTTTTDSNGATTTTMTDSNGETTTGGGSTVTTSGQSTTAGVSTNATMVGGSSKTANGNTAVMTGWTTTASGSDDEMPTTTTDSNGATTTTMTDSDGETITSTTTISDGDDSIVDETDSTKASGKTGSTMIVETGSTNGTSTSTTATESNAGTNTTGTYTSTTPDVTPNASTPATPVSASTASCIEVYVEDDATYCIEGPICSGNGDSPAGTMCPKKGDVAVEDCHETMSSYTGSSECVAPKNAECAKMETGAWGCVFEFEETATPAPTRTKMGVPTPAPTRTKMGVPTPAPTRTKMGAPTPAPTRTKMSVPTPAPTRTKMGVPTPAPTWTEIDYTEQPTMAPTPVSTPSATCTEVSVEGDATYCIEGPICSGNGDSPAGTMCPMKGDVAVEDCHETMSSYTGSSECVAPKNAECAKIKTGAWGCVFELEDTATLAPSSTEIDVSTPGSTTMADQPTPAPTRSRMQKSALWTSTTPSLTVAETSTKGVSPDVQATDASTTYSAPSTPEFGTNAEVDANVGYKGAYTYEQEQHQTQQLTKQEFQQQTQQNPSSSDIQTVSTLNAAPTTFKENSGGGGLSGAVIVGIVAAVCAVVALAGFTVYQRRQRSSDDEVPSSAYYRQPETPLTRSIKL